MHTKVLMAAKPPVSFIVYQQGMPAILYLSLW